MFAFFKKNDKLTVRKLGSMGRQTDEFGPRKQFVSFCEPVPDPCYLGFQSIAYVPSVAAQARFLCAY